MKDYFLLALGNLRHRGIRSWLTLLGIFIGIMAVVSLISLGSGLKLAVSSQFGVSSVEAVTIQAGGVSAAGPPGTGVSNPLQESYVDDIARLPTIDLAFSRIIATTKFEFNDRVDFGFSVSMPDGQERTFAYDAVELEAAYGRMLKDGDTQSVVLGYNFYTAEDTYGKPLRVGNTILIQDEKFKVVGILAKKGSFIWDNAAYINDKTLKELAGTGDDVDAIVAKVKSKDLIERAKEEVEKKMRDLRDVDVGEEDFQVSTPEGALETVNSILGGVQAFIVIIASISIFVGAIGIVNTMTTSVLERRREIGIMKSIGARNSHIFFQFLIESGLLGFVGGLVGSLFGVLIGFIGIYAINNFIGSEISFTIDYILIGGALLGSFLVGAISGIVPAWNASKQNPVDALRG